MAEPGSANGVHEIAFEAFGVRGVVRADSAQLLDRIRLVLPPGWQPCPPELAEQRFELASEQVGTYAYSLDGEVLNRGLRLELALGILESQVRLSVGVKAPHTIFIHAGVVAHRGRALVMPGSSFAGKTTLVAALVRQGAVYYSDEFAVIDERGLVHPYAKPLSLRSDGEQWQTDHSAESLGGVTGDQGLPLGAVVVTSYRPGAEWRPERLSPGEGALALLSNAVPARERPEQVMRVTARAVSDDTVVIRTDRGEAESVAPLVLAELEKPPA